MKVKESIELGRKRLYGVEAYANDLERYIAFTKAEFEAAADEAMEATKALEAGLVQQVRQHLNSMRVRCLAARMKGPPAVPAYTLEDYDG